MPRPFTSRRRAGLLVGLVLSFLAGCDDAGSPSRPQPPTPSPLLRLWSLSLTAIPGDDTYYAVKFRASEDTGLSGLVITEVRVETPFTSETFDDDCWKSQIRIEPGSTQDAFDDRWGELGPCGPRAIPVTGVKVYVTSTDDQGTTRRASAVMP